MQTFQLTREAIWYGRMSFSPDGRWLALDGKPFTLLDTTGQEPPAQLPLGGFRRGFVFVRGGSAIAYLPDSRSLHEYELATRQQRQLKLEDGYSNSITADPSGETLFLNFNRYTSRAPHAIRVMSARDFQTRGEFGAVSDNLHSLAPSADGQWLAATSYHRVRAWKIGGAKLPARAALCATPRSGAIDFALSANGQYLAIVSSRGLELWDTRSGYLEMFSGKHRRSVTAVACCPTQPVLVTADNAGQVFLWGHTGCVLNRYDWNLGEVRCLCFPPDGLRCAAVNATGKVVIWDLDA
jgi:WD40 repeat protein